MTKFKSKPYRGAKWAAALTLALLAAGCQSGVEKELPALTGNMPEGQTNSYLHGDTPQKSYMQAGSASAEPDTSGVKPGRDATSAESNVKAPASGSAKSAASGSEPQWDAAKPAILGLSIGDGKAKAVKLFGEPDDTYTLEDEEEKIEVYEYKGFAVGLNTKSKVQYVEIYDRDVSAQLSGVRVGDKTESVVKTLGKPDTQTDFMLTYEGKGSLLKLDLDPDKSKIVSIKLIAYSQA
ncbi:hypothetical protein [Paenibacillus sp. NPDC058071]|uniref:hypothetical protein n=1 Tax=Paenibacillus sp. NPDC058071 TaxID=3346326 RepID=UPI0036DCB7EC